MSHAARYGWGGPRPNSGPLPGRIKNFHPFAHRGKGNTESVAVWEFTRCNACGSIGWEVAEQERVWIPALSESEGQGWQDVEGQAEQPLIHAADCTSPHK